MRGEGERGGGGEAVRSGGEILLYCSVFTDMIYKVDNIKNPS